MALPLADPFAHAEAHFKRALLLVSQFRHAQAEIEYRHVLSLLPDAAEAHSNLANVLEVLDRLPEAETHVRIALCLNPALAEAHYNLGSLMRQQGRLKEAEAAYRQALALRPDYFDATFSLATLLISIGEYEEGWMRYESRYMHPLFVHGRSRELLRCEPWRGETLAGKSLLVWQEDGLGDMIQFARYLPMLKAAGARRITVACVGALHRLIASVDGVDAVLDHDTAQSQRFDCWTSLMSAPHHFGTRLDTIPAPWPVRAEAASIEKWRRALDALPGKRRIGLVWKGNPKHHNDENRSLPSLSTLAPLWSVPDVSFVSLQKGAHETDDAPVLPLGALTTDLADTAAIIAQLDLVIGVDTSVAHLAATMGKPCWILLPERDVDWRWMHQRDDSPWYPQTVRLFRQWGEGGWTRSIERVRRALLDF
ncbi:tetratricopeptide repeat-containing glycosyltransferase family protein [Caballeronia sp. BR00000012568055]|uniref:tetratricopeptide repeat-containing glycosyltransferase family protein n=1 Tax=Caballeronia sp. BR00000012568055 TaxID=2918761 RepID=UPI0023FA14CD|nr:tetratricopeptide repeat-containing glycosyltransferase family protein [Caballeronia sp. BR00000012568055]